MRRAAALILGLAVAAAPAPGFSAPARVVSMHLCGDQLALALADRAQIVSLSWHATDADQSYLAAKAEGLPQNYGTAEEVMALRPDLVLAGAFPGRETVALLRRLGVNVLTLELPRFFDDIARQTREVAAALGHPARGAALVAEMEAKLAATSRAVSGLPAASAILYQPGGITMGRGFLEDELLRRAGLDNVATRLGIVGQGTISLERLVAAKPDLIVFGVELNAPPSLSTRLFEHPIIARAVQARRVTLPPILWTCGAWFSTEAVERLAVARDAR
jgi:iron complex transport system substrate-binding protein